MGGLTWAGSAATSRRARPRRCSVEQAVAVLDERPTQLVPRRLPSRLRLDLVVQIRARVGARYGSLVDSATILGLAGVTGTLMAGLLAPLIAAHRAESSRLRDERVLLYIEALKHQADLRLQFFAGPLAPMPPGGRVPLAPQDEITSRVLLIAHRRVREAWFGVLEAHRHLHDWDNFVASGNPEEEPPRLLLDGLEVALDRLVATCQKSLGNRR